MNALAKTSDKPLLPAEIEQVLVGGDLSKLSPDNRLQYYKSVCDSLGLNPLTKPFAYITLNGRQTLYALKDATEQLRKIHGVSITECTSHRIEDVFVVTAKAQDKSGRTDAATGAVHIGNLRGEALANALMKAETKAKRRATLSICGLGVLDETEVETIPHAALQPAVTVHDNTPDVASVDPVKDAKLLEHAKATTPPVGSQASSKALEKLLDYETKVKDGVIYHGFKVESSEKVTYYTTRDLIAKDLQAYVGNECQVMINYRGKRNREIVSFEEAPNQNDPLLSDEAVAKALPVGGGKQGVDPVGSGTAAPDKAHEMRESVIPPATLTVGAAKPNVIDCQITDVIRMNGPGTLFKINTTDKDTYYCKLEDVATFLKNSIGGTATIQITTFEEKGRQLIEQAVAL